MAALALRVCLSLRVTDVKVNAKSKLNPFAFLMHGPGLIVYNSPVHVTTDNKTAVCWCNLSSKNF